ncbi:MAG TPA: hypothetical protein VKX31_00325 [Brumimicrobium sp.]|nr:hypothetical protein [Brumimicrobium sp.]
MKRTLKIAIIGDFNFSYNAHHATNIAVEHASIGLGIHTNYYWLRLHEMRVIKQNDLKKYDGFWLAPGPYDNEVFLTEILELILDTNLPLFLTGRSFKAFIEVICKRYNIKTNQEKAISENLFQGNQYDRIKVVPILEPLKKLYHGKNREELSNSRFSIYPKTIENLLEVIDIEAINQFEEPEIVSLKSREFCVATMSLPQITSTRESPHPLVLAFLNYLKNAV